MKTLKIIGSIFLLFMTGYKRPQKRDTYTKPYFKIR